MRKIFGLAIILAALTGAVQANPAPKPWWQKPGLGIQYQIEQRPGWEWGRDFVKFNQAMSDTNGKLKFDGPFCKVADWVALSEKVGVDYHMMELKWHDGICYFNTKLTAWKTAEDYGGEFAKLSKAAGIPFLYYYSTIFNHNPQFDPIQPNRHSTISLIGTVPGDVYPDYLAGQFAEIMDQYQPDGLWLDWYTPDKSTWFTIKFMRKHYPNAVITFNTSNTYPDSYKKLNYTSSEAHGLNQIRPSFKSATEFVTSLNGNGWKLANDNRQRFNHPWELISPAGQNWQIVELRPDVRTLARISAEIMANGGKSLIGVGTDLSGQVLPDHQKQMIFIGEWYRPRKTLFTEAEALKYRGDCPPGVSGYSRREFGAVASRLGDDTLLHLIAFSDARGPITLTLKGGLWDGAKKVYLEPVHREIPFTNSQLTLSPDQLDPIDTIVRFER